MKLRGCEPARVIELVKKLGETHLLRNRHGYEIILPFMGRLAGIVEDDNFIVKTFLPPIHNPKDFSITVRKTPVTYP